MGLYSQAFPRSAIQERRNDALFLDGDLDIIADAYDLLCRYLSIARIYYAVKANPAPEIVAALTRKGSNFDVASPAEVELCLENGASADRLSFATAPADDQK